MICTKFFFILPELSLRGSREGRTEDDQPMLVGNMIDSPVKGDQITYIEVEPTGH